jgi:tetratricopeptide (TPR) repeat protein
VKLESLRRWALHVAGGILLGFEVWLGVCGVNGSDQTNPRIDLETSFEEGNRLYEQGDFEAAAAAYDRLLGQAPGSAPLHFNLGNALFKSGKIGMAIWHYRMAQGLNPRDADIGANLQFARNQVGATVREGRVRRWVNLLTVDEWSAVSGLLFWFGMGGLVLGQIRPEIRRSLRFWVRFLVLAWVLSALALGIALNGKLGSQTAIVVTEGSIRYSPFEQSQPNFAVRDGAELAVLDSREGWVQVQDPDRGSGWIKRSLVVIHPPSGGF